MDTYDFEAKPRRSGMIWNFLSAIFLLAALCMGLYFALLFVNPNTPLNPLPPPTRVRPLETPTATITPLQLEATWTPTVTIQPTATLTRRPTFTPFPSATLFSLASPTSIYTPTRTPTPSRTPAPTGMPFTTTVQHIESTIIHPASGCNWMGIGGDARDMNNNPILFLTVRLGGTLDGSPVDALTVTGTAPQYGQGGYEFHLGDTPIASNGTIWIQLLDQAGLPLSDRVFLTTYADCQRNLVLVRFRRVR
jgi:hypothetical protein